MQAQWADGYAAELPYIPTYVPTQAPAEMALLAALAGVETSLPREGLTLLDLGCGRGTAALALAAANPSWTVTGIDAMPAHIAEARAIAAEAGLDNARFLEVDLAAFDAERAGRLLPEADVVSLHGVWTWVSDRVRAGILALIDARLRPGGLALVSYNAMPGWTGDLMLRRLLRDLVAQSHGPLERRMAQALDVARRMHEAGALALGRSGFLERLARVPESAYGAYLRYAIHEFLPEHWRPAWPQDVAADMAGAKLDFVGRAGLALQVPGLALSAEEQAAIAALPPGIDAEFLRDLCICPTLRQDVFVRGRRAADAEAAMRGTVLALRSLPREGAVRLSMPGREAELPAEVTAAALAALARGPCSVDELAALPEMADTTPGELLLVLAGSGVAAPAWRNAPGPEAEARARRFNRVLLQRLGAAAFAAGGELPAASVVLGAGLPLKPVDLATLVALQQGAAPDAGAIAAQVLAAGSSAEQLAWTRGEVERALAEGAPAWRALGMA